MSTLFNTNKRLQNLRILLTHLPEDLPDRGDDSELPLISFQIDPAVLERTDGDVVQAVCETLHAICAVVDVLEKYLRTYPGSQDLQKWVNDLYRAACKVYEVFEKAVRHLDHL